MQLEENNFFSGRLQKLGEGEEKRNEIINQLNTCVINDEKRESKSLNTNRELFRFMLPIPSLFLVKLEKNQEQEQIKEQEQY